MYVKKRQSEARETIRQAKGLGFSALMVTIDTPVVGKRAEDEKFLVEQAIRQGHSMPAPFQGPVKADVGTVPRGPYSSSLSWDDLEWIADEWANAGPLCLKGISSAADARLAVDLGYKHLYLSNHGGRQLDGAPSALETLLEIRKFDPTLLQQCEILLDGGVRKGSDILKALALGATAVGIGRPFMYALSVGGTDGVMRAIDSELPILDQNETWLWTPAKTWILLSLKR
jgi:L-lactate dehydrogenase (cytochrome)